MMSDTIEIKIPDLPDWMRQAQRGVDWALLLVIALCLTAAWSFLFQPELPHTNASENYVYRTQDYAVGILEGRLYPRWSPNALAGYGAPIPHYYPPGATYLAAVIQVIFTGDPVLAVRLTYTVALCLGGAAVYMLVMRRAGATAGVLATALFIYSPYVGLVAPHVLGDLPGLFGLTLIATLLWSADRLLTANYPLDVLIVALTNAALWFTHPPSGMVGLVLTIMLTLWQRRYQNSRVRWQALLIGWLLGFGMAGFYWIPAWLESSAIHWQKLAPAPPYSLSLLELLTPLRQIDAQETVPTAQFTLGVVPLVFVVSSIVYNLRYGRKVTFQTVFTILGLALALVSLLFFSTETWLLGVIALCLAVGGSEVIALRYYLRRRIRRLTLPTLLIVIWIGSIPVWLPPIISETFGSTDAQTQVLYEQRGWGVAVLPPGAALPTTLPDELTENRSLIDSYQSGSVNKLAPGQITTNTQVSPLQHFTHADRFLIRRVVTPTRIDILTSAFPGWTATIGNQPTTLGRNPRTGLLQVELPTLVSGSAELLITMGTTAERIGGWLIATAIGLMAIVISWGRARRSKMVIEDVRLLSLAEARLTAFPLACFMVIILVFGNPQFPLSLRVRSGSGLAGSNFVQNRTDVGLNLTAFRLDSNQHHPNDSVNLTLYWGTGRFLAQNYHVLVYLLNNSDETSWSAILHQNPGYYPTSRWNTQQYVTDRYTLSLPPNIIAGNYKIMIEVTDNQGGEVTFFDGTGQSLGTSLTLPTLINISP